MDTIGIILAAGHGKRIKSELPKVAHTIWGKPSVCRVVHAIKNGLNCKKIIIVVGIKAEEIIKLLNNDKNIIFAYQKQPKGTGHALQVALEYIKKNLNCNIYVIPGDAGLIDVQTIKMFKNNFEKSNSDLMLLTGYYDGPIENNYYGRILKTDNGEIIDILQHKDILNMKLSSIYTINYKNKNYHFKKEQLLNIREFDSGIFAFKIKPLKECIYKLKPDNIQKEIYITDLVKIFRNSGFKTSSIKAPNSDLLLGFNNKSTLKKMEETLRKKYYEILKDIISIEDDENFFIAEEVIEKIIKIDKSKGPLDIFIGEGSYISSGVRINKGLSIGKYAVLNGNIVLGKNVKIGDNTKILTYPNQVLKIDNNTEILSGDIIKGNTQIGKNVRIETGVNITGSDEYPIKIGDNTLIKGTTYIFGSIIEPNNWIEQSIIVKKYVQCIKKSDGTIQKIKYIYPLPEGMDSLKSI